MKVNTLRAVAVGLLVFAVGCSEQPVEPGAVLTPGTTQQVTDGSATESLLNDKVHEIFEPGERSLPGSTLAAIKDFATATPPDFENAFASAFSLLQQAEQEIDPGEEQLLLDLGALLTRYFNELGGFGGLCALFPGGGDCIVQDSTAGITLPPGALNQVTLFTITRKPSGCLATDNPQSAECYEFTATPNVPFNFPATLGECIDPGFVKAGQEGEIRLGAQDVDPGNGMIRVVTLPPVSGSELSFLSCQPLVASVEPTSGLFQYAQHSLQQLKGGLTSLFAPTPLQADATALALSRGVGGKKGSLSDVAAILPSQMAIAAGDGQTGGIGTEVPVDPAVLVTDATGATVLGARVVFQVTAGGGSVTPDTVYSDVNGIAQVNAWTLGNPGLNVLEASGKGIADPADPSESWNGGPFADDLVVVDHATGRLQFTADAILPGGGELVIINDVDIFDETSTADGNNRALIDNLVDFYNAQRGVQTTVWFDRGRSSKCFDSSGCLDSDLATMASIISTAGLTLTDNNSGSKNRYSSIPASVKVIFLWNPTVSFQKGEIAAFNTFLSEGGRLVLVGEEKDFVGANGIRAANRLLSDLGSSMRVNGDNVDCAPTSLPSTSINGANPIMFGLTGLTMNCAASTTMSTTDGARLFTNSANSAVLGGVAIDLQP
jgi:hypothetical protein